MKPVAAKKTDQSVEALLRLATRQLSHLRDGRLDAEYLLAHALGKTRTWLRTWPEKAVAPGQAGIFDELVQHRAIGMPLAYLTGEREFWSLPLQVSHDTLIPRPETERLVELALAHAVDAALIVELGTGSGAIALAMASELPDKTIIATDLSLGALHVAKANARAHGSRIQFLQGDWLNAFGHETIDLIVSNPPYIAIDDDHLSGDGVLFEPTLALVGGTDGRDAYRHIIPQAIRRLRPSGMLLLEHGYDQATAVAELMREAGFDDIATYQDHAGLDRVTAGARRF